MNTAHDERVPSDDEGPRETQLVEAQLVDTPSGGASPSDARVAPSEAVGVSASSAPAARPANWWRDETGRPRIFWRLGFLGVGFFAAQFGAAIVIGILMFAVWFVGESRSGRKGPPPVEEFGRWMESQQLLLMVFSTLVVTPLLLGYVCLLRRYADRRTIRSLGFVAAESWRTSVPAGLVIGGLLIGAGSLVVWLGGGSAVARLPEFDSRVLLLAPVLILAAFQEEFLIRGYVLRNYADLGRPRTGLAVSSLIFWLLHGLNPAAWSSPWVGVNLFLAGWMLGLMYLASRNLWFPTAVHFAWNFAQGPLLGVPVSGLEMPSVFVTTLRESSPAWLTGGSFGLEGSAVCAAIQCVIILAMSIRFSHIVGQAVPTTAVVGTALLGSILSRVAAALLLVTTFGASGAENTARAAETAATASRIVRVDVDARGRTSRAVVAPRVALAHTAQLLPLDAAGKLVGPGDATAQTKQAFQNVTRALAAAGSSAEKLIKLNVYVADNAHAPAVARTLAELLVEGSEPATSIVTTRLPGEALVALDAIGAASDPTASVPTSSVGARRVDGLAGDPRSTHVAVLPAGSRIDVAGQAEKGDLATATRLTLESLRRTLEFLGQSDADIVQLKSFVTPMADVETSRAEFQKFFGDRPTPPLVFVEWESTLPIEIELVARAKPAVVGSTPPAIEYFTPPGMTTSPVYSRVARAYGSETVYVSGLFAREPGDGATQVVDLFSQLTELTGKTGSDLRHLAKATYYVSDDDPSRKLNELRPKYYDPRRPPTASKAVVRGVGRADRSITLDMIAVPAAK